MRHARITRGGLGGVLVAGLLSSTGCTHNYYYGATPCAPVATTVVPGMASSGAVCEVPTQVVGGTTVVTTSPPQSGPSFITTRPPRVVVSEPSRAPRFPWRSPDPESSLATTKVDGALENPTITK